MMTAKVENTVFIVMGVSGVGKTTVGQTLAVRLDAQYIEADDFHSDENRTAMANGIALTDEMRMPWLQSLSEAAEDVRKGAPVVMACSALTRRYRDIFRAAIGRVQFIYLQADRDLIAGRMALRDDHFMPVSLGGSQAAVATVEPFDGGFQRQPRPETRAARIGQGQLFRFFGVLFQIGEITGEKGKLGHEYFLYKQEVRRVRAASQPLSVTGSKLPPKRAVLEGGEEGILFCDEIRKFQLLR